MRSFLSSIAVLAMASLAMAGDPAPGYFFQPKDRILFLGDSITEQYQYSNYAVSW